MPNTPTTQDAAFAALNAVWGSQFWLTLAYKNGTADNLVYARKLLVEAVNAIDTVLPEQAIDG